MTLRYSLPWAISACLMLAGCGGRPAEGEAASATDAAQTAAVGRGEATTAATQPPAQQAEAQFAADSPTTQAISRVLGEPAAYQATFRAFQDAVAAGDARAVAQQLRFPLRVGKDAQIADADSFVRDYARIVTPQLAQAIAAQRYDALLVNQQGVAFDGGTVWISAHCEDASCTTQDVKVVTIQAAP